MENEQIAFNFWKLIDQINPYKTMRGLCEKTGLDYWNTAQQRSKNIVPKAADLLIISAAVNRSVDYLLTGQEKRDYPPRIDRIARQCQFFASNEDLMLIERILRLPSEFEAVEKKEKPAAKGSSALA